MGLTRPQNIIDRGVFQSVYDNMRELTVFDGGIVVVLPVYGAIEVV